MLSSMTSNNQCVLLVDLTKLSDRLDVIMVGLAYRKRCIPLAWRCLPGNSPWPDKQVTIIAQLLSWVSAGVPDGIVPIVEADRGIGNSSDLMAAVAQMGWHFLFRIKSNAQIRLSDGSYKKLSELIKRGGTWVGEDVIIFPKSHPTPGRVLLRWLGSMSEPWCLATNAPQATHHHYAQRMWQEESFRDLKSGGWQWQRSQVTMEDHADRLILVLAMAYTWILSQGTRAIRAGKKLRRQLSSGRRRRYCVFRMGLRYMNDLFRLRRRPRSNLILVPAFT